MECNKYFYCMCFVAESREAEPEGNASLQSIAVLPEGHKVHLGEEEKAA